MNGKKRTKQNIFFFLCSVLLLVLLSGAALLLTDRAGQAPLNESAAAETALPSLAPTAEPDPAPTPEPTPTPTPMPTPEPEPTPCAHLWSGGVCELCGEVCPHEKHDEGSAICLQCGMQRWHSYEHSGGHSLCTGCGREPRVYEEHLPDEYYTDASYRGTRLRDTYTYNHATYSLAIWLPWDYSEDVKYNVILLMPGDKSYLTAWIDMPITAPNNRDVYCMANIYDHIAEEHLCAPFIVVGISNYAGMNESIAARWICEGVLPHVAENYSTWAEDGSAEALKAARDHFALGGLSRGSVQTYDIGMCWALDYFANFACFSNISSADPIAGRLNNPECRDLSIRCYYATWGRQDNRYGKYHEEGFHHLVDNVERLVEGENAFGLAIWGGHGWNTWSTSFFDAIQYLF